MSNSQSAEPDPYDGNNESSPSPPATSSAEASNSSPLMLYQQPTLWGLIRGAAINLILPFVNGLMLGFGELLAHEAAFRLGWAQTRVFPEHRRGRPIGPGLELRENPVERRRRSGEELDMYTSLE